MTGRLVRATAIILVIYVGLIGLTGFQFARMPTGFIPDQDIGYLVDRHPVAAGFQSGADRRGRPGSERHHPENPGIEHTSPVTGFDVTTSTVAPNAGTIFLGLPSLYGKHIPGVNAAIDAGQLCASAWPASRMLSSS